MPKIKPGEKQEFEPSNTDENSTFYKFASECSDAIDAMRRTKRGLYRGMIGDHPEIFIGRSRDDRRPMDTYDDLHSEFNKILIVNGFVANRGNSIFCSGNMGTSFGYGESYAIFPKNGFQFTWAAKVNDLTNKFSILGMTSSEDLYSGLQDKKLKRSVDQILAKLQISIWKFSQNIQYFGILSTDLRNLLRQWFDHTGSPGKIVQDIISNIVSLKVQTNTDILSPKKLKVLNTFVKHAPSDEAKQVAGMKLLNTLGFDHTNFDAALKSDNEIYIHGEYYAFINKREGFGKLSKNNKAEQVLQALGIKNGK